MLQEGSSGSLPIMMVMYNNNNNNDNNYKYIDIIAGNICKILALEI